MKTLNTMVLITNKPTPAQSDSVSKEAVAMEEDTSSVDIKHPLENTWSFWLFTNKIKDSNKWADNLVEMSTFDTVEDYWCHYHHMKLPSELKMGQEYMVFKKGIYPMWEDAVNKKGGRWLITFDGKNNSERLTGYGWTWFYSSLEKTSKTPIQYQERL